jgi:MurNAc alpha-1-phosphate uridylyltransferase
MKAMIFAAGRGERMRPLTDTTPKPLIELAGEPIIVHAIRACKEAGIEEIVINLSYKADMIQEALGDGSRWGVTLHYSQEADPPLETAGGVIKALPLLGPDPFIALSGDVWSNYDLRQLYLRTGSLKLAHLIFVPNPDFHQKGDFGLNENGVVVDHPYDRYTYGNIGLFHPDLFKNLPVQRLGLGALFRQHLSTGEITGEIFSGEWFNIGTLEELARAQQQLKETLS